MIAALRRWWAAFWIGEGPPHNHDEGDWRADCPACGLRSWRS